MLDMSQVHKREAANWDKYANMSAAGKLLNWCTKQKAIYWHVIQQYNGHFNMLITYYYGYPVTFSINFFITKNNG